MFNYVEKDYVSNEESVQRIAPKYIEIIYENSIPLHAFSHYPFLFSIKILIFKNKKGCILFHCSRKSARQFLVYTQLFL